jgi:hypothetical protein
MTGKTIEVDTICAICLETFDSGRIHQSQDDEITLSRSSQCPHIFHRPCITQWLLQHNDCPCCRVLLLFETLAKADDNESDGNERLEQGMTLFEELQRDNQEGDDDDDNDHQSQIVPVVVADSHR